MPSTMNIKYWF